MRMSLNPYDYFTEDANDRRAALEVAAAGRESESATEITLRADSFYMWLRGRDTLRPTRLVVSFGTPTKQGAGKKMADVNLNLVDNEDDNATVTAVDAKGFATPDGQLTWNNSAPDVVEVTPDEDGSHLAISALAPGDAVLTVTDAGGLTGSVLVHVDAGPVDHLAIALDSAPTPQAPAVTGDGGTPAPPTNPADSITTPTGAVVEPNPQASGAGSSAANDGLGADGPVDDGSGSAPAAGGDTGSGSDTLAVEQTTPDPGAEEQPA